LAPPSGINHSQNRSENHDNQSGFIWRYTRHHCVQFRARREPILNAENLEAKTLEVDISMKNSRRAVLAPNQT